MRYYLATLSRAQASAGLVPPSAAQSIADTCKVGLFDIPKIVREGVASGDIANCLAVGLHHASALAIADTIGPFEFDPHNMRANLEAQRGSAPPFDGNSKISVEQTERTARVVQCQTAKLRSILQANR